MTTISYFAIMFAAPLKRSKNISKLCEIMPNTFLDHRMNRYSSINTFVNL